ncbi:uncharacterized oxidoreductase MT0954-like [Cydia splendana]|uniref:uncharacterized oxidoreductase MT0954-like n=1 Tax=Cydia splendana TaxID=1100963 RepID=UPI00300C1EF2
MSKLMVDVLVTGASSGIGAAAAVLFAERGACVALVGRNHTKLAAVAHQCEQHGTYPLTIIAYVADDQQANTIVQQTVDKFGQLDVLINNVGIAIPDPLLGRDMLRIYDAVMRTNFRAAIHLTTLAAPHLIKSKGNIINNSSASAVPVPKVLPFTSYAISKAALDHFTRCDALELAPAVRVNSVSPGPVNTDWIENAGLSNDSDIWDKMRESTILNKVAEAEEIAELMLFLASEKAKSITGSIYVCDNGFLLK